MPTVRMQNRVPRNRSGGDMAAAGARCKCARHIFHRDVSAIGSKVRRPAHIRHHNISAGSPQRSAADHILDLDVPAAG